MKREWTIYALAEADGVVRYVGATGRPLATCLQAHMHGYHNQQKRDWLRAAPRQILRLETLWATPEARLSGRSGKPHVKYFAPCVVLDREAWWVDRFREIGCDLFNGRERIVTDSSSSI